MKGCGQDGKLAIEDLDDNIAWLDNMISNNDKRRHPRRKVGLKGDLALQNQNRGVVVEIGGQLSRAGVLDMSVSGAGIVTSMQMGMGQLCRVVCPLSKGKLRLNLKVVRFSCLDRAFRYGCEMTRCEKIA